MFYQLLEQHCTLVWYSAFRPGYDRCSGSVTRKQFSSALRECTDNAPLWHTHAHLYFTYPDVRSMMGSLFFYWWEARVFFFFPVYFLSWLSEAIYWLLPTRNVGLVSEKSICMCTHTRTSQSSYLHMLNMLSQKSEENCNYINEVA